MSVGVVNYWVGCQILRIYDGVKGGNFGRNICYVIEECIG